MRLPQTVALDEEKITLDIIDQSLLPGRLEILKLSSLDGICGAIKALKVRGAPAIGVAAAMGLYCLCERYEETEEEAFFAHLVSDADTLGAARPTAKDLTWALDEMLAAARAARGRGVEAIKLAAKKKAVKIKDDNIAVCRAIGVYGAKLIKSGDTLMTVCNAGALAAVERGTALAPIYEAAESGKALSVFALETRPLLQGARLTAYELTENGIDTTVICDNMAASVMASGKISAVFTGCDRVAANGDAANKVGTLMLAVLARHYSIPFYICAPFSTIDKNTPCGRDIVIEERSGEEIRSAWYEAPMITAKARIYNPAFDVTPAELITAYVTEKGIKEPNKL